MKNNIYTNHYLNSFSIHLLLIIVFLLGILSIGGEYLLIHFVKTKQMKQLKQKMYFLARALERKRDLNEKLQHYFKHHQKRNRSMPKKIQQMHTWLDFLNQLIQNSGLQLIQLNPKDKTRQSIHMMQVKLTCRGTFNQFMNFLIHLKQDYSARIQQLKIKKADDKSFMKHITHPLIITMRVILKQYETHY